MHQWAVAVQNYLEHGKLLSFYLHIYSQLKIIKEHAISLNLMILFIRWPKRVKHLSHGLTKKYSLAHRPNFILKLKLDAVVQHHTAFFEAQRIGY